MVSKISSILEVAATMSERTLELLPALTTVLIILGNSIWHETSHETIDARFFIPGFQLFFYYYYSFYFFSWAIGGLLRIRF